MSHVAADMKAEIDKTLDQMRTLRDEVRLKVHLAGMDAEDEWRKLEPQLHAAEKIAEDVTDATKKTLTEAYERLSKLAASMG